MSLTVGVDVGGTKIAAGIVTATGEVLPDSVLAEIREHDAILLGAVGGKPNDPNLPPGILERGLLLKLRFEFDHYVNLRPSRIFPGQPGPLAPARRPG